MLLTRFSIILESSSDAVSSSRRMSDLSSFRNDVRKEKTEAETATKDKKSDTKANHCTLNTPF